MPRLAVTTVALLTTAVACDKQGATVGGYPSTAVTASPTPGRVTPSPTASSGGATATPTASPAPIASPTPIASPAPTATASTLAIGALVISPNPMNFGLTSVLGATQTATITQTNYAGPFTLPPNAIVCSNGIAKLPVTATISGSTLTVTLGALGVTGSCLISVDGAPGASGSEVVNLSVPLNTPTSTGPLTFTPNPVVFNVLSGVIGSTATSDVSEAGYAGAFSLPANPISCPFNLVPLTQVGATLTGTTITITTGALNANLLGSCSLTVDDANGNSGALTVDFELL